MKKFCFMVMVLFASISLNRAQTIKEFVINPVTEEIQSVYSTSCASPSMGVVVFKSAIVGLEFQINNPSSKLFNTEYNAERNEYVLCIKPTKGEIIITITHPEFVSSDFSVKDVRASQAQLYKINPKQREKPVEPEMVFVQGGTFLMGSPSGVGYENEYPQHSVTLSSYSIGKYEVTREQWIAVMGSNSSFTDNIDRPVEQVSWKDIVGTSGKYMDINGTRYYENGFIYKFNQLTGKTYRLPTEAEWEFAARGGNISKGYTYSGSNDIGKVAFYSDNSRYASHPVGEKQPNELGIYDMSGNVWEWCSDWYGFYNTSTPNTNPVGPSRGTTRVLRGGSWIDSAKNCSVSYRYYKFPKSNFGGFRLVLP